MSAGRTRGSRFVDGGRNRARVAAARERLDRRARLAGPPTVHHRRQQERPFTAEERDSRHHPHRRSDDSARGADQVDPGGVPAPLPAPSPDRPQRLPGRQAVRQQRPVQPGVLHRRQPRDVPAAARSGGHVPQGLPRPLRLLHRQRLRPVPLRHLRGEFRLALRNAGFDGFRVITFQQNHGVKAKHGRAGLKLSLMLGLGALNAFQMADVLNDFAYSVRPVRGRPRGDQPPAGRGDAALARGLPGAGAPSAETRLPRGVWKPLPPARWRGRPPKRSGTSASTSTARRPATRCGRCREHLEASRWTGCG